MKVHLAFCPAIIPRPPLGLATLKGYVMGKSHHQVVCFDLNLHWHRQLLANPADQPTLQAMAEAVHFFETGGPEFFQQKEYNAQAAHFYRGAMAQHNLLEKQAQQWQHGQPIPPWVTTMAVEILADKPDLVGFSVCYAPQVAFSLVLAQQVRRLSPTTPIVFGGSLTTSQTHFDDFLDQGDYVIVNEGEQPLLALLNALENGDTLTTVPNLVYRQQTELHQNPSDGGIRLDDQPYPDFRDFPLNGYFTPTPVLPILTSRGCFWRRCSFCVHHEIYSESYRVAPIKRVVDEIAAWAEQGITSFSFADEMMPAKRYLLISQEILRRNLTVTWFGLARPTLHFNQDTFTTLFAAGCRFILWGVESGHQRILNLIDKGTTTAGIATVLEQSATAGIKNYIFLMVGFPSETKEEFHETLSFLYTHRQSIHNIMSGPFKLEPHSKIAMDAPRFAIREMWEDTTEKGNLLYSVNQGLQPELLKPLHEIVKTYYFNTFSLFSTWFGLLREHALYYHTNPHNHPTFYWKWHIPDPNSPQWQDTPGLQKYLQDTPPVQEDAG